MKNQMYLLAGGRDSNLMHSFASEKNEYTDCLFQYRHIKSQTYQETLINPCFGAFKEIH